MQSDTLHVIHPPLKLSVTDDGLKAEIGLTIKNFPVELTHYLPYTASPFSTVWSNALGINTYLIEVDDGGR